MDWSITQKNNLTDRLIGRQTDRQTNRKTDRLIDRQTDRQTQSTLDTKFSLNVIVLWRTFWKRDFIWLFFSFTRSCYSRTDWISPARARGETWFQHWSLSSFETWWRHQILYQRQDTSLEDCIRIRADRGSASPELYHTFGGWSSKNVNQLFIWLERSSRPSLVTQSTFSIGKANPSIPIQQTSLRELHDIRHLS